MDILIIRIVESLLLPPGGVIFLILLGILIIQRFYRTGIFMMLSGFVLLIVTSLPITGYALIYLLEYTPPVPQLQLEKPSAKVIVVLGSVRRSNAQEWGTEEIVSPEDIERLRYAVHLQTISKLPLLLSGGAPDETSTPKATLMQKALGNSFKTKAKWQETKSRNTWENAVFTRELLKNNAIDEIILVTHACHMPRAKLAFTSNGFKVIPAPTAYSRRLDQSVRLESFLPNAEGMYLTNKALHELLGFVWYQLHYGAKEPENRYSQFPS